MAAPKIIPYDVELRSVNPVRSFDRPKAYTNDLNSVEFQFKVLDMTSTELTTATAVTLVYMRDGSFFANPSTDVSRVGNVFSYLLKESEGNHAGVAQIQLVVTVDGMELASQLFDFEIINGLETKVAQEVMIYDWTTLIRDAQDYIDQFVSDEVSRDAQFDNAQFDRNIIFVATQDQRAADFTAAEDSRTTTFNSSEASRTQAFTASETAREQEFDLAEDGRATGYTSDHNRAETDHTIAVDDSEQAATDHTTAASDHTLAGSDHTRAEADHTRADADSATVAGFNTRLVAEETATANNKVSAVKGKTFSDVDARFEDVETDTTLMATNLIANGDFSSTTLAWALTSSVVGTISSNKLSLDFDGTASPVFVYYPYTRVIGRKYYSRATGKLVSGTIQAISVLVGGVSAAETFVLGTPKTVSRAELVVSAGGSSLQFSFTSPSSDAVFEISSALSIDLTATFGAGNEPTAEQMDAILAKFPNSWFNGTANLFRANATLNKLMVVDARTEFEMRNLITGGDFSNGVNPMTTQGLSNAIAVTDKIIVNGTATDYSGRYVDIKANTGDKIYISFSATNEGATSPNLAVHDYGSFNNSTYISPVGPLRTVITPAKINGIRFYLQQIGGTTYTNYTMDNLVFINLTATFGAGKEPTLTEMDRLMARFPNSWFDGVKPIQTIETLYQEKANKVQEAWITPTLINGNVSHVDAPITYYKDELGSVHVSGSLSTSVSGTIAFTFPVGYRPKKSLTWDGLCYVTASGTLVITANGVKPYNIVNFRAEQ